METPAEAATVARVGVLSSGGTVILLLFYAAGWANVHGGDEATLVVHDTQRASQPDPGSAGQIAGRSTDQDVEIAGLNDALQVQAGEGGPVGVHPERHLRSLTRTEGHPGETGRAA